MPPVRRSFLQKSPRLVLALTAALHVAGGCAAPARVADPLTGSALSGNEPAQKLAFWYQLARRPVVSNDEALHALLLYFADDDPASDYAARVQAMKDRGMLPAGFDRPGDLTADRGTIAYAIARGANIRGGVTMQLLGSSSRYADRALQYRGVFPAGSPNQVLTGGQFAAIIGRLEDFQRGNPSDARAAFLPGEIGAGGPDPFETDGAARPGDVPADTARPLMLNVLALSASAWWQDTQPAGGGSSAAQPVPSRDKPVKLKAIITGVEGTLAEIRKSPSDEWVKARVGQSLDEGGELRTGPKSAIRFIIPPDQVFTVDRQSTCSVRQAVFDGVKSTTEVAMSAGRVRLDVAPIATPTTLPSDGSALTYRFDQAGFEHDISIRSPNAALAVRGTLVSLYDEPGFAPEAVSLTGRATFENTRRQIVAFGGTSGRTSVKGAQASAAEQSLALATGLPNAEVSRNEFDNQQTTLLLSRGGDLQGDVLTGNSRLTNAELVPRLPGSLNFVLRWDGGPQRELNDLNLLVFSPLHSAESADFVGNPPFSVSLRPGDPNAERTRARFYPRTSPSGGQISKNHIGPEGLEFASWGRNYPPGVYQFVVYNGLDAPSPPQTAVDPVPYTIDVFLDKRILINTVPGSVGELQTSASTGVDVPLSAAAQGLRISPTRDAGFIGPTDARAMQRGPSLGREASGNGRRQRAR